MPSIVLRHASDSDQLTRAVESLGHEFERQWTPGDRRSASRQYENFGFNLCLVDEKEIPVRDCLEQALRKLEELQQSLHPLDRSLRGCTLDVGLFMGPEDFTRSAKLSAVQCARLANLGVDFEASFYPSSPPEP